MVAHVAAGAVVGSYLAGSIPFGVLFARARGIDLTKVGSGNIGATNAARALGKKMGVVVFLCDAAKGYVPVLAARAWVADDAVVAAVGFAAFLGHLTSPWLKFRGGKGVATGFGVYLALAPLAALAAGALFGVVYAATRISSLGSLAGATLMVPALAWSAAPRAWLIGAAAMWALILVRHRGNIARLARGQEKKV